MSALPSPRPANCSRTARVPLSSSARAHGTLRFHAAAELNAATLSAVQSRIRIRVLRIAVRHGVLTPDVAAELARWGHGGGFSLQAGVLIEAADCSGLKRLLRYCARPAFLTGPASIRAILTHLREPTVPPPLAPRARAPPPPSLLGSGR